MNNFSYLKNKTSWFGALDAARRAGLLAYDAEDIESAGKHIESAYGAYPNLDAYFESGFPTPGEALKSGDLGLMRDAGFRISVRTALVSQMEQSGARQGIRPVLNIGHDGLYSYEAARRYLEDCVRAARSDSAFRPPEMELAETDVPSRLLILKSMLDDILNGESNAAQDGGDAT